MNILLLGDCIAVGQNLLMPEITNNKDIRVPEFNVNKQFEKEIVKWFLKNNKLKIALPEIVRSSYITKTREEKKLAWPGLIPVTDNLAVGGETFQGMHKKVKEYIQKNKKPDLVLITDFSISHRCVVVNNQSQKYVIKRDISWKNSVQHIWPNEVYKLFVNKVIEQEKLGIQYQQRKNKKSYNMLTKFLKEKNINYKFLVFRDFSRHITADYEDYTNFVKSYCDANGETKFQDKLKAQTTIANHIKKHILLQ
jgi:hypothetical protein